MSQAYRLTQSFPSEVRFCSLRFEPIGVNRRYAGGGLNIVCANPNVNFDRLTFPNSKLTRCKPARLTG